MMKIFLGMLCMALPFFGTVQATEVATTEGADTGCDHRGLCLGLQPCLKGFHGCYNEEDEECLEGTGEMGCAEIYGHVKWAKVCWCGLSQSKSGEAGAGGAVKLYFSVPAFVVLFRESLEVVIVLVILVQFLEKLHNQGELSAENLKTFKREVYAGALMGFAGCMVFGVGILCLASLVYQAFQDDNRLIFEGCMMFVTSFILTYLALSFYKMINSKEGHERKMRAQITATLEAAKEAQQSGTTAFSKKYTFFLLSLNVGFREGMESIVFLIGVVSDVSDLSSLPIPIVLALICSRMVGYCFFKGTNRMRVEKFMKCSSLLLLFIAAGFFMGSVHKIQELTTQPFGDNTKKDGDGYAWQNTPVWDWSDWANDVTDRFWVLMRALLGYQDKPTPLEFFAYGFYWIVVSISACLIVRRINKQMEARFGTKEDQLQREKEAAQATSGSASGATGDEVKDKTANNPSDATTQEPGSEANKVEEKEASV